MMSTQLSLMESDFRRSQLQQRRRVIEVEVVWCCAERVINFLSSYSRLVA